MHVLKDGMALFVLACIPALNEESGIRTLVEKVFSYANGVVVCDDGSDDNTSSEAELGGAYVIRHQKNLGKGGALKSLFKYARNSNADVIVTIDGDGQFLPNEIPKIIKPVVDGTSDLVIGYRFEDSSEMPSYRMVGNKILDKVTNLAADLPFRDTQSGFRAYSKKAVEMISFETDGFGADSEILVDASRKGLRISEEKVTVIYNTGHDTSTKNPVSHSSEVLTSLIELIALRRPLLYLGTPGFILAAIGVYFSILAVIYFNQTRYFSIPSTLVALGTLIIGTMLIMMSIILYGIARTRK